MSLTTDKNDPKLKEGQKNETGQHEIYLVLSEEERAKGFVRPVRNSYVHVGRMIKSEEGILRKMTEEERKRHNGYGKIYEWYLEYPESMSPAVGKALTQQEVDNIGKRINGCGTLTRMGRELSETYARDPKFYGATYCCACGKHLPVNEFVWDGTNEEVGS